MEQARYWMWSKPTQSFYGDSWEEQAFAVDAAAGSLGGCVWPPRSYTCSFCRREFRSAQALGGHMNVHRRDRARLKQSQDPLDHEQILNHNHFPNHSSPLDLQYPYQVSNAIPNLDTPQFRVLKNSFPLFSSSIIKGLDERSSILPVISRSNLGYQTNFLPSFDLNNEQGFEKLLGVEKSNEKGDSVKTDLSISLNTAVYRKRPNSCEGEEEYLNSKRQKAESTSKSNSSDRFDVQADVLELSSSSIEELDLELNLGIGEKKFR